MSITFFFISTLVFISLIYHLILKFLFDYYKSRVERWVVFILISGGTFIVNSFAFKGLSDIEKTDYSIAYPIGITVIMYIIRKIYQILLDPARSFLSSEEQSSTATIFPVRNYKKISESDADKIGIYPRITIHDVEIEDMWNNEINAKKDLTKVPEAIKELYYSKHIIFDSSDFVTINKTFGAFDNLQETFTAGQKIKFKDGILLTERVQVDFMNIYDDYSGGLISNHTDAYEGKNTPYHIQIIVWARKIKEAGNA